MKRLKKVTTYLFIFLGITIQCFAQNNGNRYEFWQKGCKITYESFQGDTLNISKFKADNYKSVLSQGLWSALDIPQKKKDWKNLKEKYYFCAAIDKSESYLIETDSMSLKQAQLLWDICELATRIARKSLSDFEHEMESKSIRTKMSKKSIKIYGPGTKKLHATGIISLHYMTAVNDGKEFGQRLTNDFIKQVIMPQNDSSFYEFRKNVDDLLNTTKDFATSEEEIARLSSGIPSKGYKKAPIIIGDSKKRETIFY